jgi:PTH1 family peptidyl-tRNA hydrolase
MKLLVGLGNPGLQYVGTRHNVGFELIDRLAVRFGWIRKADQFDSQSRMKFDGLCLDGLAGNEKVLLLKPLTYMNLSGKAMRSAMDFYQIAAPDILIVLDDLALPCGKIRMRSAGSSGGHNGLKDIERVLSSDQYPRLRIGIDPTPQQQAGKDYVLGKFTTEQRSRLDPALDRSVDAVMMWIEKGIEPAMSRFNVSEDRK